MNKKSYSIVIPCFNSEKYLEKCLKSIYLFNKIKDFEIVIINDCSTDDTLKIILRYKKIYSNLILINNNKNLGVSESRNIGIKKSKGEYIFFIDSDDLISSPLIKIIKNKSVDVIISSNYISYISNNKYIKRSLYKNFDSIKSPQKLIKFFLNTHAANECWMYIYKKKFLIDNKIFFLKNISFAEDQEFTCKVLCELNSFSFNKIPFYINRVGGGNLSYNFSMKTAKSSLTIFLNLLKYSLKKKRIYQKFILKRSQIPYLEFTPFALIYDSKHDIKIFKNIIKKNIKNQRSNLSELSNKYLNFFKGYEVFLKMLNKSLSLKTSKYKQKNIFLFGLNIFSKMLLLYLKKNNQKCSGIIDNNVNYIDTDIKKKFSVSNIKILKNQKDFMILICNQDDQNAIQIKKQLIKLKINKQNIKRAIFYKSKIVY